MNLDILDFPYPQDLVATEPVPRGQSRILAVNRENSAVEEITWQKFFTLFNSGDVLVLNDSKVLKARLVFNKPTGAKVEVFFLGFTGGSTKHWQVLTKNLKAKQGDKIELPGQVTAKILSTGKIVELEVENPPTKIFEYFEKHGQVPLPPYIQSLVPEASRPVDIERYQTQWARHFGSVAAPTSGLHFSQEHLDQLKKRGVLICYITLHVGAGTFLPLEDEHIKKQELHPEYCLVSQEVCENIKLAQARGKTIWACGTTVLRALETAVIANPNNRGRVPMIGPFEGFTKLFVTPGFEFRVVNALITNFHQPKSSLLLLAAAFATTFPNSRDVRSAVEKIISAYQFAIEKKFRLFSYGDFTVIK